MPIRRTISAVHHGPRLFAWHVAGDSPAADGRALLILHGAGEHSQRYVPLAKSLAQDGWTVIGFDFRGHGCSDGVSVHVRSFNDYVDDVARVAAHFNLQPERTAVLAHSMGGLVALSASQQDVFRPAAMGLSAPLLSLAAEVPMWKLAIGRAVKRAWPMTRFRTSVAPTDLLLNSDCRAEREQDQLICRSLTAGWFFAVTAASQKIWQRPSPTPLLVMQGTEDRVVCPAAAERWVERADSDSVELWTLPGQVHEILHEPTGRDLAHDAVGWMSSHLVQSEHLRSAA